MFSSLQDMDVSMDILQDEEKIVDRLFLIGKKNIFRTKKKVIKQKQADVLNKKKKKKKTDNLRMFTVMNRYSVLEDNPEFDIDKIIQRNMILKTSKKQLKKCRYCDFKKRSCLLEFENCKALQSHCFQCNKKGHFPRSILCKSKRRINKIYPSNLIQSDNHGSHRTKIHKADSKRIYHPTIEKVIFRKHFKYKLLKYMSIKIHDD